MKPKLVSLTLLMLAAWLVFAFNPTLNHQIIPAKSGIVKAKVDGKAWQGEKFELAMQVAGQLHIEAMAEDGTGIKLALFGADKPGTIKVGAGNMSICAYLTPDKSYMSNVLTKPGVVELTEVSSSGAKGTFEFYCGDDKTQIHVTEGSFDVKF